MTQDSYRVLDHFGGSTFWIFEGTLKAMLGVFGASFRVLHVGSRV